MSLGMLAHLVRRWITKHTPTTFSLCRTTAPDQTFLSPWLRPLGPSTEQQPKRAGYGAWWGPPQARRNSLARRYSQFGSTHGHHSIVRMKVYSAGSMQRHNMKLYASYIQVFHRKMGVILLACVSTACVVFGQTGDTNALAMWLADPSLVWSGETNGFRVVTDVWPESSPTEVNIYVVSSKTRQMVYVYPPSGKLPRMELRSTNGIVVQPLKGKIDGMLPDQIPAGDFPKSSPTRGSPAGIYNYLGMGQNGPTRLKHVLIRDVYRVKKEEDYTLTVYPVLYKFETNFEYADRVDLPSVTTRIHLKPPN
jgi:hypothetical protein